VSGLPVVNASGKVVGVASATEILLYREVRRPFVQEREKLVGVISQTDIAHAVAAKRI